jgi:hypothetical protein
MLKIALRIIFPLAAALTLAIAVRAVWGKRSFRHVLDDVFFFVLAMLFSLPEDLRFRRVAQAVLLGIATAGAIFRVRRLRKAGREPIEPR